MKGSLRKRIARPRTGRLRSRWGVNPCRLHAGPASRRVLCLLVTLALAGSIPGRGTVPPSMILYNGTVVPLTTLEDVHEAMAIRDRRILALGSNDEILRLAGPSTQLIDLKGAASYPGFIDPHAHMLDDSRIRGLSPLEAQDLALRHGITAMANMATPPELMDSLVDMAQRGDLRIRFSLYLIYNTSCGEILGHWYSNYTPLADLAPRLRIGGIKVFSETSTCGERRAGISFTDDLRNLLSPGGRAWYGDHRPLFSTEELADIVRTVSDMGFPVAIHAIGDGGVQVSLDAIEAALQGAPNVLRHAVLHNLFIRDDLLPRYADLGLVACIEAISPCFAGFYRDLLPQAYQHIVRRWGDLAASGARVAAGSDWPWCAEEEISPLSRLAALMSPINRFPSYAGWEPCGLVPEDQLLTAWQGLRMMTIEAAAMLHRDHELGTLEPGKLADIVVLSQDPLRCDVDSLSRIEVLLTLIDGAIEYRHPSMTAP
jgi:predicted amidohydrolase YtcJ